MKKIFFPLTFFLLSGCSLTNASTDTNLRTMKDVRNAFKEEGTELTQTRGRETSIFYQTLEGALPEVYIDGKNKYYIYVYPS
ncbi:hypothetical protein [Metabacillus sp. RGM 3146]|uniref:hypothetical protein n=1 Tax=Metabacillus sp. RGM 3146 TaxID=3401092 RepID=UPI003B9A3631